MCPHVPQDGTGFKRGMMLQVKRAAKVKRTKDSCKSGGFYFLLVPEAASDHQQTDLEALGEE
jgi:hypothetical protein